MTETKTEKKAPDYSQSAEKLCNPDEVRELLQKLHEEQSRLAGLEEELHKTNTALLHDIATTSGGIADLMKVIKGAVETHGSFQDIELEWYAVKYRRMTKGYHTEPFKKHFEKYASACVEEVINVKVMEGMIKGKVFDVNTLKDLGVITETPSFAFYVR